MTVHETFNNENTQVNKHASKEKLDDMTMPVDFTHPELCAQTHPVSCFINGRVVIPDKQSWSQLLVAIIERFIEDDNPNLGALVQRPVYGNRILPVYGNKMFLMPRKPALGDCCELSNGKWINTNYNPQTIVEIIGNLCRYCGVGLSDVVIKYLPKNASLKQVVETTICADEDVTATISPKIVLEPTFNEMIKSVMSTHFTNGFKIGSPIELLRFRRFSTEDFGGEISISDGDLMKSIISCGIFFDGKVYFISPETEAQIQREFDSAFADGAETVFFKAFYDKHEEWLFLAGVVSTDMLKSMLRKLYPNHSCRGNYMTSIFDGNAELARIKYEIIRVWSEGVLCSFSRLAEKLPYIPLEKIKYVLAYNGDFIWNSDGVYTHTSRIDITEEEHARIVDYVAKGCIENGYVPLNDIPLGEIEERNYKLTLSAIQNAVFRICLSDTYDKKGKIITCKSGMFDALSIMKDYCRTIDKCSTEDLLKFQEKLLGQRTNQSISMEAAYAVFVRIDKDTFLAEKYVDFNTTAIDKAITLFVTDDHLPLKSFTTFVSFPHCGQTWNLFLLESYCRRFSERFRFDAPSVNSRNAGVVIRKNCGYTYVEVMAATVAKAGVPYEEKAVGRFLYEKGYIGRGTTAKAVEIMEKAKTIRERRG